MVLGVGGRRGCAAACFVSFAGWILLPVAGIALVAALRWGRSVVATSAVGALTGAGIPFLVVAYIQRRGPGTVCWHSATGSGCDDYLDPRPWLVIGLVLVVSGAAAFSKARTRRLAN